jgi:hypothetical protein
MDVIAYHPRPVGELVGRDPPTKRQNRRARDRLGRRLACDRLLLAPPY